MAAPDHHPVASIAGKPAPTGHSHRSPRSPVGASLPRDGITRPPPGCLHRWQASSHRSPPQIPPVACRSELASRWQHPTTTRLPPSLASQLPQNTSLHPGRLHRWQASSHRSLPQITPVACRSELASRWGQSDFADRRSKYVSMIQPLRNLAASRACLICWLTSASLPAIRISSAVPI